MGQHDGPLTFAAIGDIGEAGDVLSANARAITDLASSTGDQRLGLLFFLGDNFYPIGLNHSPDRQSELINECLAPFRPAMELLGRHNVHGIAGNHDYYCEELGPIPLGTCIQGNMREMSIPWWVYHMIWPTSIRRSVMSGSIDSVEFILFDSALLLTTDQRAWKPVLDSLGELLRLSATAPGIRWRIILAHHSPVSVGEHGGWRRWDKSRRRVEWVGNCADDGMDPRKYVEELISSQDNCAEKYRAYSDSLTAIVRRSGATVQLLVAGHDHSLQFLDAGPERHPRLMAISGAGAERSRVRNASPPHIWTHPLESDEGRSIGGFLVGRFDGGRLTIHFVGGEDGRTVEMGGATSFVIDVAGRVESVAAE